MSNPSELQSAGDALTSGVYGSELRIAIELAQAAGAAILKFYGKPLVVEHKGDLNEPVTEADRAANELIVGGLQKAFPDDGILAEESIDTARRLNCERVWVIDPLDGTRGFIEGSGEFAVHIGLAVNGESVLGIVYQPVPDVLYWAARRHGAWMARLKLATKRLRVSTENELSRMRLAASRAHRSQRLSTVVRSLGITQEVQRHSVGVKVGLIVEQQCDIYIHLSAGTKQWDTCAPEIILREAGGQMTDLWGEPLRYNSPDAVNRNGLVATNGVAHQAIIERIVPLLNEFGRTRVEMQI